MRRLALAGVVVAALALATVHWLGLLVGGVGVGLLARSWRRALAGGAAFGLLAWLVFAAHLAAAGRLAGVLDAALPVAVSAAIPLCLGVVGALAYGLTTRGRTA